MKEVTYYRCEKCRREFPTKAEAEKCESMHTVPVSVALPKRYKSPIDEMFGYPRYVVVSMANGQRCRYVYDSEVKDFE